MVMCFVPDCKHYSERKTCKFFVFPANPAERAKWIDLISRQDKEPSKYSLVCSCHFENEDRKNGPTIFEFNAKRKLTFPDLKRKRIVKQRDVDAMVDSASSETKIHFDEAGPSRTSKNDIPGTSGGVINTPSSTNSDSNKSKVLVDAENHFLKQKLEEVTKKLEYSLSRFSYEHIKNNDSHLLMYTGIPSNELFLILFECMDTFNIHFYDDGDVKTIPKIDQLLLTLMKLRLNVPHKDLAIRFNCSTATITNIVMTWIYALHEVLFNQFMETIPCRQRNQACLPVAFFNLKNCRIILDCAEIYSAIPSNMDNQRSTYSSYKHINTWKVLVGIAPNGVVTYVSKAYPGSTSDKKIFEHCGIVKNMHSGDLVIADKGFLIRNLLPDGVSLNIPPFLSTPQFTESQVYETQRIARARIHVERAIRRIKCYSILQNVPHHYISQISIIFQVCAALTNFQYPLMKEVEEYYC